MNQKLKKSRESIGMSRVQISAKVGIRPSTWTLYENHSYVPEKNIQEKISKVLKCDVSHLFPKKENRGN